MDASVTKKMTERRTAEERKQKAGNSTKKKGVVHVSKKDEAHNIGIELAGLVGEIASDWAKSNKNSGVHKVRTRPVNGSIVEVTFVGTFSDERKERIKDYLLGAFKKKIAPDVARAFGSKKFRISRCPRDKSDQNYCWFIQKR